MQDTNTIIARFQTTNREETQLPGVDGAWASGAQRAKTFTEGIEGASEGLFITSGQEEGQRAYMATERIIGTLPDGRSGSFVVQHGGLEAKPDSWFGYIVNGTGSDDLAGIAGSAVISHDEQGAYFTFVMTGSA